MKNRWIAIGTIASVFAAALCGVTALARENEEKEEGEAPVTWESVPAPVQKTIQAQLGTGQPEVITLETDDGFSAYEAARVVSGQLKEVKVSENGQLLEIEDNVEASSLPAAVGAWLQREAPDAEIEGIVRVSSYYYEIEIKKGERTQELKVLGSGQEVEEEDDEEDEDEDDQDGGDEKN